MTLKSILTIPFILIVFSINAQEMQEGFTYLETGKFQKAEAFFETILKDYPKNKTARLCYGRAVGLNGNAKKANQLFMYLMHDYSQDTEVKLNFGESLLWLKQFETAKRFYKNLLKEIPNSFPALLGYANTLSNLKEYEDALVYVNKALNVSPGNANALTSKKYIYLGYAYQKQQAQDYSGAEALLKENLTFFNNDKDTLLNLANLYLIVNELQKAKDTYNLIAENPTNKITALNGLALVSHLNGKDKDALKTSKQAFNSLTNTDETLTQQTTERYIQALIWNKKYKKATSLITGLIETKPNDNWVLALRATLNTYKGDFKKSLLDYNAILKNDSTSFDGNLGKANTKKALGLYNDAYTSANKTLSIFKNQKDAVNFINILDKQFTPFVKTKTAYSIDNGDNEAYTFLTNVTVPLSTKLKVNGVYSYRDSKNTVTNNEAKANNMLFGLSYLLHPNIGVTANIGVTDINAKFNDYTQFLTDITFNIKPLKLQTLDLGFKREWQDFNADLLSREIVQNTLYTNYNVNTNFNLGWYTQYNYTWQNDNNERHLLFTSLYYNLLDKPLLKTGLNYQYITFKDQVPTIYFSPERFNVIEVFVDLIKNQKGKWFYNLNAATGFQFIENQDKQSTYRFQGKLGYNISNRFTANLYGLHSNIASTTATGFTFTEVGFRLKWDLFRKPVFRK
ncbi:tetratricopeptide repeat protein [uncultured Lacinutrix sp.]|uniref:tetratricopeptide repeat protein n=1 Tax=uncultured Lacinutrix sp. TaxID=574032 RepID=UPI002631ABFB|nr:tetratricopeptide repeat protein [uncultured Lacinutrix sp.]